MSSTTRATTREPAMTHPHIERVSRGEARWQWRDPRCGWRELLEAAIADLAAAGREPAALALHHEDDATRLEVDLQPEPGPVSIELLATGGRCTLCDRYTSELYALCRDECDIEHWCRACLQSIRVAVTAQRHP
ncbi:MAG TPA: hypothetical protein VK052_06555 [Zeimonas sp.]|nr:hypothetical protein [Zeimonas sp.]